MGRTLVTAAASLPVSVAALAAEIVGYQPNTRDDATIALKLAEATDWVQEATARQFIQATYLQTWCDWQTVFIPDISPLYSVASVKYYDVNGVQQTLSSSEYWVDTSTIPGKIVFKPSFTYPAVEDGRPSAIEVRFVAGYTNADAVPAAAKQAIKLLAKYWYEKREAATIADSAELNSTSPTYGEIPFGVFSIVNMINASGYT